MQNSIPIPPELLCRIFRFLSPYDLLLSACLVSRRWRRLAFLALHPTGRVLVALNLNLARCDIPVRSVVMSCIANAFFAVPDPTCDRSRLAAASCSVDVSQQFFHLVAAGTAFQDIIADFAMSSVIDGPRFPLDVEWLVCDVCLSNLGPDATCSLSIATALSDFLHPTSVRLFSGPFFSWVAANLQMPSVKHVRVDLPADETCVQRALEIFPFLSSIELDGHSRCVRNIVPNGISLHKVLVA
ncbi:hypothetical protein HDU93_001772 [Gonapodya sp. JEL0774]|nr:hypothetical protein HDU93_001772 [Gonapodya sp. JEL0774]